MYLVNQQSTNGAYPPLLGQRRGNELVFPDEFLSEFYKAGKQAAGFVTVTDDGTTVTSCVWNEDAYQAWLAEQPDPLEPVKAERISQSKTDLADYLETHPMTWLDGNTYSATAEKQQQLTSKLLAATMAKASSHPYTLLWNTSGGICQEWTLDTLSALAFAIDAYVTPLVKYQQTQEVAMRNAVTQEELDAIVVDYDTVGAAAQEVLL